MKFKIIFLSLLLFTTSANATWTYGCKKGCNKPTTVNNTNNNHNSNHNANHNTNNNHNSSNSSSSSSSNSDASSTSNSISGSKSGSVSNSDATGGEANSNSVSQGGSATAFGGKGGDGGDASSSIDGSGNSSVSNTITHTYPLQLNLPELLNPNHLGHDYLQMDLVSTEIEGLKVTFIASAESAKIIAHANRNAGFLYASSNHGLKRFGKLINTPKNQFTPEIEQVRKVIKSLKRKGKIKGAQSALVRLYSLSDNRAASLGLAAGKHDLTSNVTRSISSSMGGSTVLPFNGVHISFYSKTVVVDSTTLDN